MAQRKRTFDPKRAQALYESGHGCNAIARQLEVSPSTVSKWAKDTGRAFDRSQVEMAVRAHVVDLAETRLLLAQKMAVAASDMLDALDGPYLVYSFGGRDNDYNEHELERAPVEVVRNAVTVAGIAFDKATRVVEGSQAGADDAKSLLSRLGRALGVGADAVDNPDA